HLRPDGIVVVGFGADRGYALAAFDTDIEASGLRREHRFATWDLRPWHPGADFAVTVLRLPAE
ncbi:SAM-dependent methyltransferase, partial [Polymorphospora sp. 2-325]